MSPNAGGGRGGCEASGISAAVHIVGSMTFLCGKLMDPVPDPAIFVIDLQDANKKIIFLHFFAYYCLKVH
jgi:hypothetical protein